MELFGKWSPFTVLDEVGYNLQVLRRATFESFAVMKIQRLVLWGCDLLIDVMLASLVQSSA